MGSVCVFSCTKGIQRYKMYMALWHTMCQFLIVLLMPAATVATAAAATNS